MDGFNIFDQIFLKNNSTIKNANQFSSIGNIASIIIKNVFVLAGVIFFVMIIAGGYSILSSSGDVKKVSEGKKSVTSALLGFLIIFGSYWIIQIIEILTGFNIFNPNIPK
jgi:hypothetical protein